MYVNLYKEYIHDFVSSCENEYTVTKNFTFDDLRKIDHSGSFYKVNFLVMDKHLEHLLELVFSHGAG